MGKADIDAFQAEAEAVMVSEEDAKAHFETPEPETAGANVDDLAGLFKMAYGMLGGLVCSIYQVAPLAAEEVDALAEKTAAVAGFYNMPAISEKAVAWIGLATVTATVVAPRIGEYQARAHDAGPDPLGPLPEEPEIDWSAARKSTGEGDPNEGAPLDAPQSPYKAA